MATGYIYDCLNEIGSEMERNKKKRREEKQLNMEMKVWNV